MSIGGSIVAILLTFASPAAAIYLVGDSHTIPIVGGGGPGYPELIPDAEWFGCGAGTAGALDSDRCGASPTIPGSYLLDIVLPAAMAHDVVTIMYGTVDLARDVPSGEFVFDVLHIVDVLRRAGIPRVIYLGPPDRPTGPSNPYYEAMLPACETFSWFECGPNFQDVIGPEHYDPIDPTHPNSDGHALMARALIEYLPEPTSSTMALAAVTALSVVRACKRSRNRRNRAA